MRGKDLSDNELQVLDGITPAYAGKSNFVSTGTFMNKDHPRVCGEKAPRHALDLAMLGSPPRMRGKVNNGTMRQMKYRITPAYAGKRLVCLLIVSG